jgi:hypothetical protein
MLTEQYRMSRAICRAVSEAFYGGKLVTAAGRAQQERKGRSVCFVNVAGKETQFRGRGYSNEEEACRLEDYFNCAVSVLLFIAWHCGMHFSNNVCMPCR